MTAKPDQSGERLGARADEAERQLQKAAEAAEAARRAATAEIRRSKPTSRASGSAPRRSWKARAHHADELERLRASNEQEIERERAAKEQAIAAAESRLAEIETQAEAAERRVEEAERRAGEAAGADADAEAAPARAPRPGCGGRSRRSARGGGGDRHRPRVRRRRRRRRRRRALVAPSRPPRRAARSASSPAPRSRRAPATGRREGWPRRSSPATRRPATRPTRSPPAAACCRPGRGAALVEEAPAAVGELRERGVEFDLDPDGELALGLEGGHTRRRIVHAGGSQTGHEITSKLAAMVSAEKRIEVREMTSMMALWSDGERCHGVVTDGEPISAAATVLATGGAAALWRRTTNPRGAIGAGPVIAAPPAPTSPTSSSASSTPPRWRCPAPSSTAC